MFDHPFHVVGGAFQPVARPLEMFDSLLRHRPAAPVERVQGSRRRKLWEIAHKFHCPVIGVCFGVDELRGLMDKIIHLPGDASDFMLHTSAVSACEERSPLAELLQKNLEKRFQQTIRRFAAAKTSDALRALWQETVASGSEIPDVLWSAWTHPACDAQLEQEIYGDIHMIQHQIGTGARADLSTLKRMSADNSELRRQLDEARHALEAQRAEKAREVQLLDRRIAELRSELAGKEACTAHLTGQLEALRQSIPELKERQALARRASDAEGRASAQAARNAELEEELQRHRDLARRAEETIRHLRATGDGPANIPEELDDELPSRLSGKCILCVGGRSGSVDAYRQIVEQRGGRFLHHDGGLEESLHRIDAALSAADLVVCQAGCISHNAYWRVKEQCKRTGKQCLFLKGSGVSSFGKAVSTVGVSPASNSSDKNLVEVTER